MIKAKCLRFLKVFLMSSHLNSLILFYYEIIKCSLARLHVVEGMLRAACCEQSLVLDSILDVEARLEFVIKLTEERLSVFDGGVMLENERPVLGASVFSPLCSSFSRQYLKSLSLFISDLDRNYHFINESF